MALILVDTNILVYAHDPSEPQKKERAVTVLHGLASAGAGRLTTQVVGEFFHASTRGREPLLTVEEAAVQALDLLQGWTVLDLTAMVVAEAIRGVAVHQLAYWDAQLWAVARLNQIPAVFSEDFNSGATLDGVRFVDPLRDGFDLRAWL